MMQITPRRHTIPIWLFVGLGTIIAILLVTAFFTLTSGKQPVVSNSSGATYYVNPVGNDVNEGKSPQQPLKTIQKALDRAQPGDQILLADGRYEQNVQTVRSGSKNKPITLKGGVGAVVVGAEGNNRIIQITHDFITLDGFHVDGKIGAGERKEDYRDKLIYMIGTKPHKGVEGVKITKMLLENAGGECLRIRYFAKNNEVAGSTIRNCGIYDFRFKDGGKNGEGIYIGTAPEQRKDGKNPDADPDVSTGNFIHHNTIETYGNECVDVKEASTKNLIEHNTCRFQQDPNSAGLDSRGAGNIFRYNTVTDTRGAGVRLGGDGQKDGISNDVYGNIFERNEDGMLNIQRYPQGKICGNQGDYQGEEAQHDIYPTTTCKD